MTIPKFLKHNAILLIILLLASVLRLWNLGGIPPHLRNDEAALGYNAYSVLNTGRDEHGELLPIIFQSFGDWKMGFYVYFTVPFIAALGLNEETVRLPSALAGIVSVFLIYEIVNLLFVNKKLSLISAFIWTVSPLFIAFSRGAWEVNLSLVLTLAAILFFLKAANGTKKLLLVSAMFFGLSLLASHTAKLTTPILILILSMMFARQFRQTNKKLILLSILTVLMFAMPVGLSFIEGKTTRLTTLSIFSYYSGLPLIQAIANRWFSLYTGSALFIKGDANPQHTAPNSGSFLLFDSIFLTIGLIELIRKGTRLQKFFVFPLLLLLPASSAFSIEGVNFERALPFFIPMVIVIALGINKFLEKIKERPTNVMLPFFALIYLIGYIFFLDQYFYHGPKKNDVWQYGYKEIFEKLSRLQSKEIIVQQSFDHPYIFYLFYQRYNPQKYQNMVNQVFRPNQKGKDMGLVSGLENIRFADINWSGSKPDFGTIFVMPIFKLSQQSNFYSNYQIIDEIKDLNGFSLFKIVKIL